MSELNRKFSITRSTAIRRPSLIRHTPKFYRLKGQDHIFETIIPVMNADSSFTPQYQIIGGFNNNAIQITLPDDSQEESSSDVIQWICLLTFTGFQFKYIGPNTKRKVLFALADEDAYCYCDKDPCIECRFKCKNGFAVYTYWRDKGLYGQDISAFSNK